MNMIVPFAVLMVAGSALGFSAVTFTGFGGYLNYVGITIIATLGFVYANSKLDLITYVVACNTIIAISALVVICIRTESLPSMNAVIGCVLMVVGVYFTMR